MPASVVDASAIGALLFGEPAAERMAAAMDGLELAAPTLLPYEIASVCLKKVAAHPGETGKLLEALELLPGLGVKLFAVPPPGALETARRAKLSVYDGAYLWLAVEMGAGLVTLDERLARAWKRLRA